MKADLEDAGYTVFLETDKEWTYTGRENRPADALAFKGNVVISIEMKTEQELSPKSPPSGDSLKYDYSAGTREKGRTMIENGEITREEGMHRVHINQAEHYANKLEFLDKDSGRELSKSGGCSASEPGCSVEIYNGAVDPILQRGRPQHSG